MNISTQRNTGINLQKGNSISLRKEEEKVQEICIGLNWGAIEKKSLFGLIKSQEDVDLDGSVTTFDNQGGVLETIYYGKLMSSDYSIRHSGDDLEGDVGGDDGTDNEVIQINLHKVREEVTQIVIYLNSYNEQDFAKIPFSKVRIFKGNKYQTKEILATFNLSADTNFAKSISMIMGKLVRAGNTWEFYAIGEATSSRQIDDTISVIQEKYL